MLRAGSAYMISSFQGTGKFAKVRKFSARKRAKIAMRARASDDGRAFVLPESRRKVVSVLMPWYPLLWFPAHPLALVGFLVPSLQRRPLGAAGRAESRFRNSTL